MTIRNRVRYCDKCGLSLRGQDYMSAAGLDFHLDDCPGPADDAVREKAIRKVITSVLGDRS